MCPVISVQSIVSLIRKMLVNDSLSLTVPTKSIAVIFFAEKLCNAKDPPNFSAKEGQKFYTFEILPL